MAYGSPLGIRRIYSFEFVVDFFDRSREFYINKLGFKESHRSTPEWEKIFSSRGVYFSANKIKILVSSPLSSHAYTARFLKTLSPGIRKVTFLVEDLQATIKYLQDHDATFIHEEKVLESEGTCHRFITITTPIGFLEFSFLQISGDENAIPLFESLPGANDTTSALKKIDHLTINARTLYPIANFFEHVMGMEEYWRVAFHTPDYSTGREGTGLTSRVMWDPASKIKFATNEPLCPHFNESQIQTFIDRNHGAGIQHIAFSVETIIDVVNRLRGQGVEFLDTPDSYYDLLMDRLRSCNVAQIDEALSDLKDHRILVDGKDDKYLLQIFLKDASLLYDEDNAGPFFYELIQRKGHQGFGEGNFRALFEAIESEESKR
ncbi:MAG: 4-hydroxyphenylpyruvate dioxygenase [Candidatus Nitrohelix vancouverensis]|uniref:4-hydroxyphenylpyruvate dioxygenase n=1 Tax=Candidatus Nitrohelix vancouverensis TaxID=2705534 RepID=A0A7T0G2G5_9BACT|nr:MAG: 4-hydroxyphenylpyruvate dioxygenase [Candidatus Nitrohelix vancouverensis]